MTADACFLGIDLAWHGNGKHSGLAALHLSGQTLTLAEEPSGATDDAGIDTFLVRHQAPTVVAAIDAPLIIANETGQRPCETEIGRTFGKYHASAHTSNLRLFPAAASVRLARRMIDGGFRHPDRGCAESKRSGKTLLEVYPHPAHVRTFGLTQIFKYKKGKVAPRREQMLVYRDRFERVLRDIPVESSEPLRVFMTTSIGGLRGKELKAYEDQLDALFCAFLAYQFWRDGWEGNEMIGGIEGGYIVVPKERSRVAREF